MSQVHSWEVEALLVELEDQAEPRVEEEVEADHLVVEVGGLDRLGVEEEGQVVLQS